MQKFHNRIMLIRYTYTMLNKTQKENLSSSNKVYYQAYAIKKAELRQR